nr:plasmid pRiA4b ORF-3 family protein [Mycobacterium riyadhense]
MKSSPKLPAKRKTKDGPAPVLQLRVDLRASRPPIWRRLQVRGDIALRELHKVLQVTFNWHSTHMYAFDTAYGQFGIPDPELGLRSDAKVTLEQVAAGPGTKLTYTYDFGDDWEHLITVEDTVPCEDASIYPRCVGGRRKAPPEDCGGIWGIRSCWRSSTTPPTKNTKTVRNGSASTDPTNTTRRTSTPTRSTTHSRRFS